MSRNAAKKSTKPAPKSKRGPAKGSGGAPTKPDSQKRTEAWGAKLLPGTGAILDSLLHPGQSRADFLEALALSFRRRTPILFL